LSHESFEPISIAVLNVKPGKILLMGSDAVAVEPAGRVCNKQLFSRHIPLLMEEKLCVAKIIGKPTKVLLPLSLVATVGEDHDRNLVKLVPDCCLTQRNAALAPVVALLE
jgi:hypothetical protein